MSKYAITVLLFLLIFPRPVEAYLDPGTGSYITQLAIGLALGASYLIKVYWSKIKTTIRSFFKETKKSASKINDNK